MQKGGEQKTQWRGRNVARFLLGNIAVEKPLLNRMGQRKPKEHGRKYARDPSKNGKTIDKSNKAS